ncbi:hypothetical protein TNCV_4807321 [Trichonephila clavipes]|nr:hypothetical protein TNCV_4807321 [Trichonephila clavipes]
MKSEWPICGNTGETKVSTCVAAGVDHLPPVVQLSVVCVPCRYSLSYEILSYLQLCSLQKEFSSILTEHIRKEADERERNNTFPNSNKTTLRQ